MEPCSISSPFPPLSNAPPCRSDASRANPYGEFYLDGVSLNPFEVLFVKVREHGMPVLVPRALTLLPCCTVCPCQPLPAVPPCLSGQGAGCAERLVVCATGSQVH